MWLPWGGKNATGKLQNFVFGKGPQSVVPPDMQGLRKQNIDLLMSLLSPGAFDKGGVGNNFFGIGDPNAMSPETSNYNSLRPILEGMMTGTGPQFEHDISAANSQGGRFASSNAILRGEALRNLFNQRTQTAGMLGTLSSQAGSSQFQHQNQLVQLMAGLLGMGGQASLQFPVQNDKGAFGDILKMFASLSGGGGGAKS
jgi:hypothetical protein